MCWAQRGGCPGQGGGGGVGGGTASRGSSAGDGARGAPIWARGPAHPAPRTPRSPRWGRAETCGHQKGGLGGRVRARRGRHAGGHAWRQQARPTASCQGGEPAATGPPPHLRETQATRAGYDSPDGADGAVTMAGAARTRAREDGMGASAPGTPNAAATAASSPAPGGLAPFITTPNRPAGRGGHTLVGCGGWVGGGLARQQAPCRRGRRAGREWGVPVPA